MSRPAKKPPKPTTLYKPVYTGRKLVNYGKTPQYNRVESKHRGFGNACPHCKVVGRISLGSILTNLQRGLTAQNLLLVAIPGKPQGTPAGFVGPLLHMLRTKGITVK